MLKLEQKKIDSDGKWFEYSDGVEFQIRPLTGKIMAQIRRGVSTMKMETDPATRRMVPVEKVDLDKLDDALSDYILQDFRGVGDSAGNALEPTLENKKLIFDQITLRDFIWNSALSLDIEGEQIKNS